MEQFNLGILEEIANVIMLDQLIDVGVVRTEHMTFAAACVLARVDLGR
jgi:hypothetical protein